MLRRRTWLISGIFLVCDAAVLIDCFRLATLFRALLTPLVGYPTPWHSVAPLAQLGTLLAMGIFLFLGLYPGYGLTAIKELERISSNVTLVFLLVAAISFINKPFQIFPRSILLIAWALSLVFLPLTHFILRNLLSHTTWYGIPVIIFGDGEWTRQIEDSLRRVGRLGWQVKEVLPLQDIEHLVQKPSQQIAILAPSSGLNIEDYARVLSTRFQRVVLIRQKDNFGSLWVEPRDMDGHLGLEFHYHLLERSAIFIKRVIDLSGSLFLLIVLSPLFLILTLLVLMDSRGPIFFLQERTGKNFKHFKVVKFRTMIVNSEQALRKLILESPSAKAEFEQYHKLKNDPRITRVGKLLRKLYLDEIPQLWNVLKGEMSLVGPRPVRDYEIQKMGNYAPIILRVNPGMTGWWQVLGRHDIDFHRRVQMDEYYISNWSFWMDIYVLLKTIQVVLSGKGS